MEKHVYKHNIEKIIQFKESGYPQIKAYGDQLEWGTSFTHLFGYLGTTLDGTVKILEKTTAIFFKKVEKKIAIDFTNPKLQDKVYAKKLEKNILKYISVFNGISFIRDCYTDRYIHDSEHSGISDLHEFHVKSASLTAINIPSYKVFMVFLANLKKDGELETSQEITPPIKSNPTEAIETPLSNFDAYCINNNPGLKISKAKELADKGQSLISLMSYSANPIYVSQEESEADEEIAALIWWVVKTATVENPCPGEEFVLELYYSDKVYSFLKSHPKMYRCNDTLQEGYDNGSITSHRAIDTVYQPLPGNKKRIFFKFIEDFNDPDNSKIYINLGE